MNKNRWSKEKIIELNREWRKFRRNLKKRRISLNVIPTVSNGKPLSKIKFAIEGRKGIKLAIETQNKEKADVLKRQALKNRAN